MFRDLFVNKSDRMFVHLLRSIFSSNLAFAVDFGILVLLTEAAGLHYLVSNLAAFMTGMTISYLLSVIWAVTERAGVHYLLSKVIAGCSVFFFNFFTRRRVLFR